MKIIARENAPLLPFDYSPEGEEVSFRLRGLTTGEMLDVQGLATLDVENKTMNWTRRAIQSGIKSGLLGWSGFRNASGEEVMHSKDAAENIERLGIALTMELFGKIMEATRLNGEQAKN